MPKTAPVCSAVSGPCITFPAPAVHSGSEEGIHIVARVEGIVLVVDRARSEQPYVAAVDIRRVFRQISETEMEGLPLWEQTMVNNLLENGAFARGSQVMTLRCGEYSLKVVSVTAPSGLQILRRPGQSGQGGEAR